MSDLDQIIERHLSVLNKLDSHLGCAKCHGPLTDDARCPECQPLDPPEAT